MKYFFYSVIFLILPLEIFSQSPADLDLSFNSTGYNVNSFIPTGAISKAIEIQPDGKIICAGNCNCSTGVFFLDRYLPNGTLDLSFGDMGRTAVQGGIPLNVNSSLNDLIILPDGKIIACGTYQPVSQDSDILLIKFKSNGELDSTFGLNGFLITDYNNSSTDKAYSISLQPDGKIVVGGDSNNGSNNDFFIIRFDSLGVLDPSFDFDGKTLIDFGGTDFAGKMELQNDGKIIIGGSNLSTVYKFALARLNPNGSLDNSFGIGGKKLFSSSYQVSDKCISIALQSDGKIVASGNVIDNNGFWRIGTMRSNSDGTIDNSFGVNGWVSQAISPLGFCEQKAISIQSDGYIVTSGYFSDNGNNYSSCLIRYNQNGVLDPGFGIVGIAKYSITNYYHVLWDLEIQSDGKILFAGQNVDSLPYVSSNFITRINGSYYNGINDFENLENLTVFPNPSEKFLDINLPENYDQLVLQIFDLTGKIVMVKDLFNTEKIIVNTEHLDNGLYLIRINTENKLFSTKFYKN